MASRGSTELNPEFRAQRTNSYHLSVFDCFRHPPNWSGSQKRSEQPLGILLRHAQSLVPLQVRTMMSGEADKVQMLEGMRDGLLVRQSSPTSYRRRRSIVTRGGVALVSPQRSSEVLAHDKWRLETYQQLEMLKLQLLKESGYGPDDLDEAEESDTVQRAADADAQASDSVAACTARSIDQVACSKADDDELDFEGMLPSSLEVLELESMMEAAMRDMAGRLSDARSAGTRDLVHAVCNFLILPLRLCVRQGRRWRREKGSCSES